MMKVYFKEMKATFSAQKKKKNTIQLGSHAIQTKSIQA